MQCRGKAGYLWLPLENPQTHSEGLAVKVRSRGHPSLPLCFFPLVHPPAPSPAVLITACVCVCVLVSAHLSARVFFSEGFFHACVLFIHPFVHSDIMNMCVYIWASLACLCVCVCVCEHIGPGQAPALLRASL